MLLPPPGLGLSLLCLQLYQEHRGRIRSTLHWLPPKLPAYHNLEWRLDVQVSTKVLHRWLSTLNWFLVTRLLPPHLPSLWQVASRSLHQQLVPTVTLHLSLTSSGDSVNSRVLQTDPSTLLHIISTLEAALETSKSSHARRIWRSI